MEYPKTRKEAKEQGATHYYTGLACSRGHIAPRKTKGVCVECMKEDWAADNEKRKLKPKSEAAKEAGRRYYERNRDIVKARANARPAEEKQAWKKIHKQRNPDYYNVLTSLRKRRHRNATPKWLTYKQKNEIKQLYQIAVTMTKTTGERYVVDHIVPLISDEVCGLHVPWNLRVITQEENLKKSNKLLANHEE
jgi:hypothetical protein